MDPLSEILRSSKMEHTRVGTLVLGEPWGLRVQGFDLPVAYGMAAGAKCWLRLGGGEVIELRSGDIVLVRGRHDLLCSPQAVSRDMGEVFREHGFPSDDGQDEPDMPLHLRVGGAGAQTRLIGLAFGLLGGPTNPLLASLPSHILLRKESKQFPWIDAAVEFLTSEHAGTAGYTAMARLVSELVFVSILRYHLLEESAATKGWLRGLTDPAIAKALLAIHEDPGAKWTVGSLASRANLSRTAFAVRFAGLVEVTPIEYLTHWRMHVAAERIVKSDPNLTQLAFELGYASDAAFRNAFKLRYGVPPSRFERSRSGAATANARPRATGH